jgi:hypothetical protein
MTQIPGHDRQAGWTRQTRGGTGQVVVDSPGSGMEDLRGVS